MQSTTKDSLDKEFKHLLSVFIFIQSNVNVIICRSLFVLLSFFFLPLCCLYFFELRILITSLWYLQILRLCMISPQYVPSRHQFSYLFFSKVHYYPMRTICTFQIIRNHLLCSDGIACQIGTKKRSSWKKTFGSQNNWSKIWFNMVFLFNVDFHNIPRCSMFYCFTMARYLIVRICSDVWLHFAMLKCCMFHCFKILIYCPLV